MSRQSFDLRQRWAETWTCLNIYFPEIAASFGKAFHFNTFGGSPIACAVGSSVIDVSPFFISAGEFILIPSCIFVHNKQTEFMFSFPQERTYLLCRSHPAYRNPKGEMYIWCVLVTWLFDYLYYLTLNIKPYLHTAKIVLFTPSGRQWHWQQPATQHKRHRLKNNPQTFRLSSTQLRDMDTMSCPLPSLVERATKEIITGLKKRNCQASTLISWSAHKQHKNMYLHILLYVV